MSILQKHSRRISISKFSQSLLIPAFCAAMFFCSSEQIIAAGTFVPASSRVDMVYDSTRDILYITNGDSVLRYQLASNTFLSPFTMPGASLKGIDLSPDGTTLVIADQRRLDPNVWVYVVNLPTQEIRQVLMTRSFGEGGTYAVAYASDGTVLTTSSFEGSGWIPLRKLNPITGAWTQLAQVRNYSMVRSSGDLGIVGYVEADSSDGPFGRFRIGDGNLLKKSGYTDGTSWFNYEMG